MTDQLDTIAVSPLPAVKKQPLLNFYSALQALAEGKRISRMEWQDANVYGFLGDNSVRIMTYNEQKDVYELHTWEISYYDLFAEDWMVLD